ncbi:uncharacterized protein L201_004395 [Kwoniella dendrophila CBS 6074]|uniref:Peptidase n=1 Tax=Kwoniella dendrophila CBS 6074 TaxID=1295534 RepID=A0AAX4JVM1_9TREE
MKTSTFFSIALALIGSKVNAFNLADVQRTTSGSIVPGRYIVEFDSNAHLSSSGMKRDESISTPHEAIYKQLKERDTSYTVHQEYSDGLFIGASITLNSDNDLANLLSTEGVIDFRQVHLLSLPETVFPQTAQWPAAANLPDSTTYSSTSSSAVNSNSTTTTTSAKVTTTTTCKGFSVLGQIGAESVQASGNKGKGVKIGIIDGGVDYTREPLGGCYGKPECKFIGGYDFVGDSYNGTNSPIPDNDPFDNCYTHGTITAGLIGANSNGNKYNVVGVAPEASLLQYRVFGCNGATTDDIVLQAMQRAYNDGVDIINLSVGESSGWTESMLSVFASRLTASGVVLSISAGNRGQVGSFYSYSPGSGIGAINVGANDNAFFPAQQASVSTGHAPITYFNYQGFTPGTYPLYAFNTDPSVAADGCTIPAGTPNLKGYVVLVRRGGCALEDKAKNIYYQGGRQMLLINTQGSVPLYQNFPLDFGFVSYEDGNYLLSQIGNNHTSTNNTTLTFTFNPYQAPNVWTGNITSYFSEIGPTNDLFMAPSIVAPGTNLISIVPSTFGNWSMEIGTSFSTPLVSGASALYIASKGGSQSTSPDKVKSALQISADYLTTSKSDQTLANVAVQGSGKLNVAEALNQDRLIVSPSEILLNDSNYFASTQYLTLTNPTNKIVKYTLSNLPAGTLLSYQSGLNQSSDQPVPQVSNGANVKFSQSSVTLLPRSTWVVLLQFQQPQGLDSKRFPVYSGFIQITGGSTNVQVPYLGVAAKMKDMPILDGTSYYLGFNSPTILNENNSIQSSSGQSYNFQNGQYPTVIYRLVGGTPLLLIDLIDSNLTTTNLGFTPNYNSKRDLIGDEDVSFLEERKLNSIIDSNNDKFWKSSKTQSLISLYCQLTNFKGINCSGFNQGKSSTFGKVPILGNLYEQDFIPRSTDNIDGAGEDHLTFALKSNKFSNGTIIPNGTYKFLLRTLHITGDRSKQSDYESWVSAPFTIST